MLGKHGRLRPGNGEQHNGNSVIVCETKPTFVQLRLVRLAADRDHRIAALSLTEPQ